MTQRGIRALERVDRIENAPEGLWDRIRSQPERAPEHIALAAAERLAPAAERWAADNRGRAPEVVAHEALKKHVRLARAEGAIAGLGGAWGIVPDLAALTWLHSRMVFFIAASYGFDPGHEMRPAELLVLQGIYETANEARAALDGTGRHMAIAYAGAKLTSDRTLASKLMKMVGERAASKAAGKLVPGIASPIMAVQNAGATKALGQRALRFYGG